MYNLIRSLLARSPQVDKKQVDKGVAFSIQKYHQTYKLLENNDKAATHTPAMVSERRNVQKYIRRLQGSY